VPGLTISLLGVFEVQKDGALVSHFESLKGRALLAYLAAEAGRPHARGALAGLLWPDWPEAAAQKNLRHTLYSLRKTLGDGKSKSPLLHSDRQYITFIPNTDCQIDVQELEKALAAANRQQTAGDRQPNAVSGLRSVVELYRGPFLEGFTLDDSPAFEEWVLGRREHHSQQMLLALGQLADWHEGAGEYAQAEAYAHRQLELEPWREKAHQQLMRVMALRGERVQALSQYENLRQALKAELGVQPSPETVQLYERIRAGTALELDGGRQTGDRGQPGIARRQHNLPVRLSSFIGREKEIEQVISLLQQQRLVTLTGTGGVGKSSLALQAAGRMLEAFPDGVWLVELAPLSEGELLPQACKQALGMVDEPGVSTITRLAQFLEYKHVLLVLDNCEHLIDACASLAETLLQSCHHLHILATSREMFSLPGEYPFLVPSMSVPTNQTVPMPGDLLHFESVRLFVERAAQVAPGFGLTDSNAPEVTRVVQRLDGIPLAIELAAARMRTLTVEQVAARLDNVFHLLTGGGRAALPRQQTLRACIEWSYDLLLLKERLLLQRLSVFAGNWILEAAEAVCAESGDEAGCTGERIKDYEVLDLLAGLVDKSLVLVETSEPGNRYYMLETIRQYASERLRESGCYLWVRDHHLTYYARLSEQAEPNLRRKDQVAWMDRLEQELDNLRLAMERSQDGQIELGLKMVADLTWFWWIRNLFQEGDQWMEKLLSVEKEQRLDLDARGAPVSCERALQRARVLRARCQISFYFQPVRKAQRLAYLDESVEILRSLVPAARGELGIALQLYAHSPLYEPERVASVEQEMLEILTQEKDAFYLSEYYYGKYTSMVSLGDFTQVRALLEESLRLCREMGDLDGIASRSGEMSLVLLYTGDHWRAIEYANEAIELTRETRNQAQGIFYQTTLLRVYLAQGENDQAVRLGEATLGWAKEINQRFTINMSYTCLLYALWAKGDFERVDQVGVEAIQAYHGNPVFPEWEPHHYLGRAALSQGNLAQAKSFLRQALTYDTEKGDILPSCAVLFSRMEKHHPAALLFGAVQGRFERERQGWPQRERNEHEEALAATRQALGEQAFVSAWAQGKALTLEQAVELALEAMNPLYAEGLA